MSNRTQPPGYAELQCFSNFSFQRGASSARELVAQAVALGYRALAITDECSLAGIVRAHEAAREQGLALLVGTTLNTVEGDELVLLVQSLAGYRQVSRLITEARRRADKGEYEVRRDDVLKLGEGLLVLSVQKSVEGAPEVQFLGQLATRFCDRFWLALALHRQADDEVRLQQALAMSSQMTVPLVAIGAVEMHVRKRRPLHDVLTAIRLNCTVAEAGLTLRANAERVLRSHVELTELYPPDLLEETARIADRCHFSLAELKYQYPPEVVPQGVSASAQLRLLTEAGAKHRWPQGMAASVHQQIEHELALIGELGYDCYFLTVHDLVRFARSRGILCQGRGSAANSAVCFCLGITEVDPARGNLLFERFISRERNEPPDIDVDFEHERREEVIQYVYAKYGRDRAALTATVICYRAKSAIRDVGKALGLALEQVESLSSALQWWDGFSAVASRLVERGFDPESTVMRQLLHLARELLDFPRHLSQHVGGFVIAAEPLCELVPIENAAMADRTVIQWDKDDLDALGFVKVDLLALGMLSAIRKCFDLVQADQRRSTGEPIPALTLATIPAEDPQTYEMIRAADTVGVFQIESRAQMAMLPRLRPTTFYDLVIEVAIVRPGPIQGKMVHPYLRRRQGVEQVTYPSDDLRRVFERTLGVPIFQEQVMQLAIVAAGFSPGEADGLRRSMAAWKRKGGLEHLQKRIVDGMLERGYDREFAEQVFEQIKGFGSYGFPESHAASFALLAYASSWLKCHQPVAFACALVNSQPMGFYSNSQILQDLRRHGFEVLPPDVRSSNFDATIERPIGFVGVGGADPAELSRQLPQPSLRLGLREIRGMRREAAERIMVARAEGVFRDLEDLCLRAELDAFDRARLAEGGALAGLVGNRHQARWQAAGVEMPMPVLKGARIDETQAQLSLPGLAAEVQADYRNLGYSLKAHPLQLLREELQRKRWRSVADGLATRHGSRLRAAGLVTLRQRPGTAAGVTFLTLEDETGWLNVIVWKTVADQQRRTLLESSMLGIEGELQSDEGVTHLIAHRLVDLSPMLQGLDARSRDFH
ncbi:MAG: error-prone DNA polymerase [Ahniella sp.]|nr:error-prone DNA polymerase [Ahniella sp.]